jgi:hypothetical protein
MKICIGMEQVKSLNFEVDFLYGVPVYAPNMSEFYSIVLGVIPKNYFMFNETVWKKLMG